MELKRYRPDSHYHYRLGRGDHRALSRVPVCHEIETNRRNVRQNPRDFRHVTTVWIETPVHF
jgi:hypothetical protein